MTLLEVLIAVVVLAVGLLGVAMAISVTMRDSQQNVMHAQVTQLAQSMMDRMASNLQGVWLGAYDTDAGPIVVAPGFSQACRAAPCNAVQLAGRDKSQWGTELAQLLSPDASARIECTPFSAVPDAGQLRKRPTYDGICSIALEWNEIDADGEPATRRVGWRFVP